MAEKTQDTPDTTEPTGANETTPPSQSPPATEEAGAKPAEAATADGATPAVEAAADEATPDEAPADEATDDEGKAVDDGLPANVVTIASEGPCKKTVTIEVPRERIDAKFNEIFGELHTSAQVPGFRIGHAPRRLLEKRFGKAAAEDVRNALVSESLAGAAEEHQLEILGAPAIKLDEIELPDSGPLTFSVEMEVAPEFALPEYKGIAIAEPPAEATQEQQDQALREVLASRGTMVPTDEPAIIGDLVVTGVKLAGEGIDQTRENVEYRVGPGAIEGVPVPDLGEKLTDAAVGKEISFEATVSETHDNEDWRGKAVTVTLNIQEVKRLEIPELTDELAGQYGMDTADQFTDAVKARLSERLAQARQQSLRSQVQRFLLENSEIDLPDGATTRHTASVLRRRYVDLLYRGVPRDQIDQNMELLEAQAGEEAREEMKLSFILSKVSEAEEITVEEGEINARIATMARQYGRRPERLRHEMENQGTLDQVEIQLREQKAIDKLLELAEITPAPPVPAGAPAKIGAQSADKKSGKGKGAPSAKKKSAKKKSAKAPQADTDKADAKDK